MSHNIDQTTGTAAVFTAGQPAWHQLGTNVAEAVTSDQAIQLAGLDWEVEKHQLRATVPTADGQAMESIEVPDKFAVVRSDRHALTKGNSGVLGVVGNWYVPFQNRNAFDFMDSIVDDRLAMFETAGSLNVGKRVWMLARLPESIEVAAGDVVHPYILVTNSHDGTSGLNILPTTVRVVCANTLNLALSRKAKGEGIVIRHTDSLDSRVAEARAAMKLIGNGVKTFAATAENLAARDMTRSELSDYFTSLVESQARGEKAQKRLMEKLVDNLDNPRNSFGTIGGTAWAAYNAVSEYADHQMTVRGQTEFEKLNRRVDSQFFGSANRFKQKAFERVLQTIC